MARIPPHIIEDAPAAARPLLAEIIQFSPSGRLDHAATELDVPAGPARPGEGA